MNPKGSTGEEPSAEHDCYINRMGAEQQAAVLQFIQEGLEQQLRNSQRLTQSILDSLHAGIVVIDREGIIQATNSQWQVAQQTEGTGELAEGGNYLALLRRLEEAGSQEAGEALEGLEGLLEGRKQRFRLEFPSPLGRSDRWFQLHATPLKENPAQMVIAHRDITRRRHVEMALRESEERLRRTILDAPIPVIIHAEGGQVLLLNQAWTELSGYHPEELPTLQAWAARALGPETQARLASVQKYWEAEQVVHTDNIRIRTADGRQRIWDFSSAPAGSLPDGQRLRVSMALDITERHQQEQEIQQRAESLAFLNRLGRTINRAAGVDQVLEATLEQIVALAQVDGACCLLLEGSELLQLAVQQGLEPALVAFLQNEGRILCGQERAGASERLFYTADSEKEPRCFCGSGAVSSGYRSVLCVPLVGRQQVLGRLVLYSTKPHAFPTSIRRVLRLAGRQLGVALDRAHLFEKERSQRLYLEALQKASATVNSSLDLKQVLEHILSALASVVPYDSASVMLCRGEAVLIAAGRGLPEGAVGQEYWAGNDLFIRQMQVTQTPVIVADVQQDSRFHKWGGVTDVRGWMTVPLLSRDTLIGYLTLDSHQPDAYVTEDAARAMAFAYHAATAVENARLHQDLQAQLEALEMAQARLLQSEKLAALGQMIAGVAHELNNPLAAITLLAERWQRAGGQVPGDELEMAVTQALRARDIVSSLLNFSRRQPPAYAPVRLQDVLRQTLDMLDYELHTHNVNWTVSLPANLPLVHADPHQLQQVFINLLNNTFHVLRDREGGHIEVTGETGPSHFYRPPAGPVRQMVRLAVVDNGPGIPPALLSRIFDPFFTTKKTGEGTGLGLSVCHGIINQHNGHIWAESHLGQGSTFYIELPLLQQIPRPADTSPLPAPVPVSPSSRILVIDDEQSLQEAICLVLQEEGYTVEAVGSGQEALERLRSVDYALLLCDIRMPGLNGYEFYRLLKHEHPALVTRILFVTGDTVNVETRRFFLEHNLPHLQKPFGIEELLQKVSFLLAN